MVLCHACFTFLWSELEPTSVVLKSVSYSLLLSFHDQHSDLVSASQ